MHKIITVHEHWNGTLLNECFPMLLPAANGVIVGDELQIMYKKQLAGYAKVVCGRIVTWSNITDNISYSIMAKPVPYFKKVMASTFGFSDTNQPRPEFPLFFGMIQWQQRHLYTQVDLFNKQWQIAQSKPTQTGQNLEAIQETLYANTYNDFEHAPHA